MVEYLVSGQLAGSYLVARVDAHKDATKEDIQSAAKAAGLTDVSSVTRSLKDPIVDLFAPEAHRFLVSNLFITKDGAVTVNKTPDGEFQADGQLKPVDLLIRDLPLDYRLDRFKFEKYKIPFGLPERSGPFSKKTKLPEFNLEPIELPKLDLEPIKLLKFDREPPSLSRDKVEGYKADRGLMGDGELQPIPKVLRKVEQINLKPDLTKIPIKSNPPKKPR